MDEGIKNQSPSLSGWLALRLKAHEHFMEMKPLCEVEWNMLGNALYDPPCIFPFFLVFVSFTRIPK